jgi:hypothetical protein
VTRDEYVQATRVEWALRTYGPGYAISHGGMRGDRVRWYCGPASRRKAARDRHRRARARPLRTLTRGQLGEARARRVPAPLREVNRRMLEQLEARRQAPACEQLSLLGGEP